MNLPLYCTIFFATCNVAFGSDRKVLFTTNISDLCIEVILTKAKAFTNDSITNSHVEVLARYDLAVEMVDKANGIRVPYRANLVDIKFPGDSARRCAFFDLAVKNMETAYLLYYTSGNIALASVRIDRDPSNGNRPQTTTEVIGTDSDAFGTYFISGRVRFDKDGALQILVKSGAGAEYIIRRSGGNWSTMAAPK